MFLDIIIIQYCVKVRAQPLVFNQMPVQYLYSQLLSGKL